MLIFNCVSMQECVAKRKCKFLANYVKSDNILCQNIAAHQLNMLSKRWLFHFLPHDAYAMHSTYMPRQDVHLSACLSHAGIVSKLSQIILNFFSPSGSPTILVFPYQTGWQYSDGDPLNESIECKRGMKNHDFRPISGCTLELMQDRATVTIESE